MHRSIELGRAVLSTPAVNLELWLKTLITVSPQQQYINLQQHDAASLLEILSSGKVWVGRGHGLHIDLNITSQGQPLVDDQLQQLSEAILHAPVWKQMGLNLSLAQDAAQPPGKLRIEVAYAVEDAAPAERQHHRLLLGTSAVDIRPPPGIQMWYLDAVFLHADIFELHEQNKVSSGKRLKVSVSTRNDSQPSRTADGLQRDNFIVPSQIAADATSIAPSSTLKRPRRTPPSDVELEPSSTNLNLRDDKLEALIDGAFRVSIFCRINGKTLPGVKVKTNTFGVGLADVAPNLWRPGYRLSLSQRASLVPVIGRSLCRTATATDATSSSFMQKVSVVTRSLSSGMQMEQTLGCGSSSDSDTSDLASSIISRLWQHLQENQPCKSTNALQSFVCTGLPSCLGPQTDRMLEAPLREKQIEHRSGLHERTHLSGEMFDYHRTFEDCPSTPISYCQNSPEQPFQIAAIIPDHGSEDTGDELLLGDGFLEPLSLVSYDKKKTS